LTKTSQKLIIQEISVLNSKAHLLFDDSDVIQTAAAVAAVRDASACNEDDAGCVKLLASNIKTMEPAKQRVGGACVAPVGGDKRRVISVVFSADPLWQPRCRSTRSVSRLCRSPSKLHRAGCSVMQCALN